MTPGFYGKIPAKGDFIQRGLPPAFTQLWDQWLQSCVEFSKAQLGEQWLNTYLVSPLWRFAICPKVFSDNAWVGVMMPSVDSVGRYFPLTICAEIPPGQDMLLFAQTHDQWFSQIEDIALSSLSEGFDFATFEAQLNASVIQLGDPTVNTLPTTDKRTGWTSAANSASDVVSATCMAMINQHLPGFQAQSTFWWTLGSESISSTLLRYQGLPSHDEYQAMLSGAW